MDAFTYILLSLLTILGIIIYWYAKAKMEVDLLTGVKTMDEIRAENKKYWDRWNWDTGNPENPSSPFYMDD